jgi:hypothetical protein
MKKQMTSIVIALTVITAGWGMAFAASEHGSHGNHGKMDHGSPSGHEKMDHGAMGHESKTGHGKMDHGDMGSTFTHETVMNGIKAEFQVMSLASMNMRDPEGNTHHVMAKFFKEATTDSIKAVVGKVKVIRPSGDAQTAVLKDYSGIFAANFTVKEKGKYGIICLFKIGDVKHVAKFWYPVH